MANKKSIASLVQLKRNVNFFYEHYSDQAYRELAIGFFLQKKNHADIFSTLKETSSKPSAY